MILLLDADGVIANFEKGFLNLWRREFPDAFYLPIESRRTFYCDEEYPSELKENIRFILRHPELFSSLEPIAGAQKAVKTMIDLGVDVRICTSPLFDNFLCASQKLEWIDRYFGREMARRTIITKDKGYAHGDYLVDDKPSPNCFTPSRSWEHVIMDAPYNQGTSHEKRIMNWTDGTYLKVLGLDHLVASSDNSIDGGALFPPNL